MALRIGATATTLLGIGAVVLGVMGLTRWSRTVVDASGAVCGSAWHYRPGHGSSSGGERTQEQVQAATEACRQAARGPYLEGRPFIWCATGALVLAVLVIVMRLRSYSRRQNLTLDRHR